MKEPAPPPVPGSLFGELRALVRLYRGEPVLESGIPENAAGVVVVLGTKVLSGGRPSGTLQARTRHAARLYARGEVAIMIPTGGIGKHPPSEAEVMAKILREEGV
jgi:vancomycin permeability regulator SanA